MNTRKKRLDVFSLSLPNRKNRGNEDALFTGEHHVFAVADGVSRSKLQDGSYPNPSGAALAAQTFCRNAGGSLEHNAKKGSALPPSVRIFSAIAAGNKAIAELNRAHGIPNKLDWLAYDYFCSCGAVAYIDTMQLAYGWIGDCGIMVFDADDLPIVLTPNDVGPLEHYREGLTFTDKNAKMHFWRKTLRNRFSARHRTYGVLTGESEAEQYIRCDRIDLSEGDLIVLYSDGFYPFLMLAEFRALLRSHPSASHIEAFVSQAIENHLVTENVDDDKTLIAIVV